jgi:plasmid replication initiation protein
MTAVLSQSIKPFLLGLIDTGFYTQAELINFLALKSKYSKRLYEILKSYLNNSNEKRYRIVFEEFEIMELKKLVAAENYGRFKDFRVRVLDIAMREINDFTDIIASYTPIKPGRITTHVRFCIQLKKPEERFMAYSSAETVLSGKKQTVTAT